MTSEIASLNLALSAERTYWSGNIFGEWVKKIISNFRQNFKSIIKRQGEFISELGYEKLNSNFLVSL